MSFIYIEKMAQQLQRPDTRARWRRIKTASQHASILLDDEQDQARHRVLSRIGVS